MTRPPSGAYPTQQELLESEPIFEWLDRSFLRCDPYAFAGADFQGFALLCSQIFDVDPNGVFCIGSGAVGLSLNPAKVVDRRLKPFDDHSDLDVALISDVYFELAWRNLRAKAHPALNEMEHDLNEAMKHQRKRFFDGAILANKLLPHLDFGAEWFRSHVRAAEYASVAVGREIDVNIWIYRDYWSVRSYVANGILKCKEMVR